MFKKDFNPIPPIQAKSIKKELQHFLMLFLLVCASNLTANEKQKVFGINDDAKMMPMILHGFKKYNETSVGINKYFNQYIEDKLSYSELRKFIRAFSETEKSDETFFNEWVSKDDFKYVSRVIRGEFYNALAWDLRGNKYIKDTSDRQLFNFNKYIRKAIDDYRFVMKEKPDFVYAHISAIYALRGLRGTQKEIEKIYNSALEHTKTNYDLHLAYLSSLFPRWGGTYIKLDAAVAALEPLFEIEPKLKELKGLTYHQQSLDLYDIEDKEKWRVTVPLQIELIDKALSFNRSEEYLRHKSRIYSKADRQVDYYRALSELIDVQPNVAKYYAWRVNTAITLKDVQSVAKDSKKLIEMNYELSKYQYQYGWALFGMGQFDNAIKYFEMSLKFPWSQWYKSRAEGLIKDAKEMRKYLKDRSSDTLG